MTPRQEKKGRLPLASTLPEGWTQVRSSDLFTFVTSGSRGWARYYSEQGPRFLRVGNLKHDTINLDLVDVQRVQPPAGPELNRTRVRPGDLLISVTADVGMVGLVPEGFEEAYVNQHVAISRPVEGIDRKYLAWYLAARTGGQRQFKDLQRGATKVGLGLEDVRSVIVPLPPLREQARIVAAIEANLTRLDAGLANLERVRAKLKRYRAAVLKSACEGRLVPTEAELARSEDRDYEPASRLLVRIVEDRRARWKAEQLAKLTARGKRPRNGQSKSKYQEPDGQPTAGLGTLPEGWAWATVEQLSFAVQYGSSSKTNVNSDGVPVLRMGNIVDGRLWLDDLRYLPGSHKEFPALLLEAGDVLFNRTNSAELVGKTAVYRGVPSPCSFASYLIRVRLVDGLKPEFLAYYLNSPKGRAWVASVATQQVGQANVNGSKLQALAIPIPPAAEQGRIVAEVERRLSLIDELDAIIAANLKRANRLRQSILKRAFEGSLVPQDSTDEPAAVLLERIGAGRMSQTRMQL